MGTMDTAWHALLALLVCGIGIAASQKASVVNSEVEPAVYHGEYCEGQTFTAECAADEAIVMIGAKYGRMGLGECITISMGSIGCNLDVLTTFDQWCSGRRACEIRVSSVIDEIPEEQQPCSKEFRSYLEASYKCVKVITPTAQECLASPKTVITEPPTAFLSSLVTEETGCGSLDSPWQVKLPQGQRMKITMYDFNTKVRIDKPIAQHGPKVCHVYAVIKEESVMSRETVCGSKSRKALVYTSMSNVVEIRFVAKRKEEGDGYFLIRYEAIGCPELQRPVNGWLSQHGDTVRGGCNGTDITYTLHCDGQRWSDQPANCSAMAASIGGSTDGNAGGFLGLLTGSQWAAIVIIAAIAVTLGLIIFLIGLVYLRRKRSRFGRQPSNRQLPDYYSRQQATLPSDLYPSIEYSSKSCPDSTGYIGGGSTENDYFRTWQLQRHPPGIRQYQSPDAGPGPTPTSYRHADTGPPFPPSPMHHHPHHHQPQHVVEHIYESPKFDRKHVEGGDNVQYYELDPHLDDMDDVNAGVGGRLH